MNKVVERIELPHGTFYAVDGLPLSNDIVERILKHFPSVEDFYKAFNESNEHGVYSFLGDIELMEGERK